MKKELSKIQYPIHRFQVTVFVRGLHLQQRIASVFEDRRQVQTAHYIRDRRRAGPRMENFIAFMFIQGIMGIVALLFAFAGHRNPLTAWLLTSYIFSITMFLSYKSLARMVNWIKAGAIGN